MKESEQQQILESWLAEHQTLLFKVVRSYAFTPADQDDLFQEIAIQVWRSIPSFKGQSKLTTWLYRLSLNTALNWTRREQKHQDGHQPLDVTPSVLQARAMPSDERLTWLYEQIARLHKVDRSLMLLLLDGFSYREISNILGISESSVGVKIHRVKKYLIEQSKTQEHHGI